MIRPATIRPTSRIVVLTGAVLLCTGFAWPPDYAEQSRKDVSTCVSYARLTSPTFEAWVRGVDLQTGHVDIERSPNDSRGELAFSRCLLSVRHWHLIERNLPKPAEPAKPDLATMAGRAPDSPIR